LPGLIPYFFVAWAIAGAIVVAGLALDEYRGDRRSILPAAMLGLWIGSMLTLLLILSEVRAKGLISANSLAGMIIGSLGSLGFSFSFMRRARRTS
jgi:hypothetical protein